MEVQAQKLPYRCRECGQGMEVPYKSYILSLGECCGMELLDFCSEDCYEKYLKEN